MLHRKSCIHVYFVGRKIGIVHTYLHIEIIDIGLIEENICLLIAVKKSLLDLIRKFKIRTVYVLVYPSYVEPGTEQTGISKHLVIGNRTIYPGSCEAAGTGYIMQNNTTQSQPSRFNPVAKYLGISPDAH